jgi:hypothetical protein
MDWIESILKISNILFLFDYYNLGVDEPYLEDLCDLDQLEAK